MQYHAYELAHIMASPMRAMADATRSVIEHPWNAQRQLDPGALENRFCTTFPDFADMTLFKWSIQVLLEEIGQYEDPEA